MKSTAILIATAVSACRLQAQQPTLVKQTDSVIVTRSAQTFTIKSNILNETRQIDVLLPASFNSTSAARKYPVIVAVDGMWMLGNVATAAAQLTGNGLMPEAVIVAIENIDDFQGRVRDLTPPGLSVSGSSMHERGDQFIDFIERELLPAVDRQFRGGEPRVFVGTSSGGILATWIAATRTSFRGIIALDTPTHFQDNWLAHKLIEHAKSPDATPIRYASYEVRFGYRDELWSELVASAPKTWQLHREKIPQEGHETMQMVGSYLGLREIFHDYSRMAAPGFPTTSILPYYARVDSAWRGSLFPPRRIIRDVVENLIMEGRGRAARTAYEQMTLGYGAPADSQELLRQIRTTESQPEPTETVEGLLQTPFPTPAEARAYLGDWEGETWATAEMPHQREVLHIFIENGKVMGETETPDAPPEYRTRRWEYLHITPTGMSFGYMNGMRPRGVILNEATRSGNELQGATRFGGIHFTPPNRPAGQPIFYFKYKKIK